MTLFELYATLGLDTTDFQQQADQAVEAGESAADEVAEAFEKVDTAADGADKALEDVKTKSGTTEAVINGLAQATEEIVSKIIEGIIDLGKESIEAASKTGSAMAESYLASQAQLDASTEAFKMKLGNWLLPAATVFNDLLSSMMGVSDSDRLVVMLGQLDSYSFENIEKLSSSLDSVFGRFQTVEYGEGMNVEDMLSGLESQVEYWQQYNQTLMALDRRGLDTTFLASIADGTMQSFETLKALEEADSQQLESMMSAFETLESVKASTVSALNEMQLYVDEDYRRMAEDVAELVSGMDQSDAAYANALLTGDAVSTGLADAFPNIQSMVDSINATLAQIGSAPISLPTFSQPATIMTEYGYEVPNPLYQPKASGMSYVPYDGYRAELHMGEGILTRQQNAEYLASQNGGNTDAVVSEIRGLRDAILGMRIAMDKTVVGHMVSDVVSEDIARKAGAYA